MKRTNLRGAETGSSEAWRRTVCLSCPCGKAALMNGPPMDSIGPQLWMSIENVFHIKGRGTVVTGRLEGYGLLSVGDTLVCEGQHWPITAIEKFRAVLKTAEPGSNIGVLLRNGPPGSVLAGQTVQFLPSAAAGSDDKFATGGKKGLWRRRG
jgi:translation elongation factor EF-Tu-like GTPase